MDLVWGIIASAMAILGSSWFALVLHEYSHYVSGRAIGVPREKIAVRLTPRPPHVAIHDDHEWLSPDHPEYIASFLKHDPRTASAWFFVAAGAIGETVITMLLAAGLALVGLATMALFLAGTSTVMLIVYICADLVLTRKHQQPYGDFAGLWQINSTGTALLVLILLVVRIAMIVLIPGLNQ